MYKNRRDWQELGRFYFENKIGFLCRWACIRAHRSALHLALLNHSLCVLSIVSRTNRSFYFLNNVLDCNRLLQFWALVNLIIKLFHQFISLA